MVLHVVRFKYSNRLHPSAERIHSRKRLPNCPNQHFSSLQHNSEFQSRYKTRQDKTVLKRIHRATRSCSDRHYSNTNLRLRANFLMGYRNKIFSPVPRNDVTRSPGRLTETYSLGLPCTSLILDIRCYDQLTPIKTSYPLTSIT